jgi:hypothetical protein
MQLMMYRILICFIYDSLLCMFFGICFLYVCAVWRWLMGRPHVFPLGNFGTQFNGVGCGFGICIKIVKWMNSK